MATGPYPDAYEPADEAWLDGEPVRLHSHFNGEDRTVYLVVAHPPTAARP